MHRILILIGLLLSSFGFSASIAPENQFIAVVDAGNSGSKLHIYSYKVDGSNMPFEINNVFTKKIEPGLASIELNQGSINQYLSSLFSDVPYRHIPTYFYATSGMRMLSFARQQAYYAKVTHWFTMQSQWELVALKTLRGREEALYGWVAVNYELGALSSKSTPLVSVVDTGSASLQIAMPIDSVDGMNQDDYVNVDIYGRHVSLFIKSFLGLGQDEIRSQYLDNPDCFSKHYPLPNGSLAEGDFELCKQRMKPLINDIHQVDSKVKSLIQKQPEQTWYIIGGISAMLQERPFVFEHNEFTTEELGEKTNQQVCQQDWSILGILYQKNKYLFANCLSASYFYSLFVDGLGVSASQKIHYISNKISTNDWTLGVIFYQKSQPI